MKYLGVVVFCMIEIIIISSELYSQSNPVPVATITREENNGSSFGEDMDYGDINGDGIDDLITCDLTYDNQYASHTGRVYIFFGRNFSGVFSASSADIIIDGQYPAEYIGIVRAGNLDGDQYADLIISAPALWDTVRGAEVGRVYVFYGTTLRGRSYLTVNECDLILYGDTLNTRTGVGTVVFDFDDDGLDDMFICSFARDFGGGIYQGENRLNVFYAKNLAGKDSLSVFDADLYFYPCDSNQVYAQLTYRLTIGLRMKDINNDKIHDLVFRFQNQSYWLPDTITVFYGKKGGIYGKKNFNEGDILIHSTLDYGGYENAGYPFFADYDGNGQYNLILSNPFFHFDPEFNNMFGRVYLYGDQSLWNGMPVDDADHHISGTIPGALSGYFGKQIATGDMNNDGKDELIINSYGLGYAGAQYLFRGRSDFPDSLMDADADVKIAGHSGYSGLHRGCLLADIMGTGKKQWIVSYAQRGSETNGFIDIYPETVLIGIPEGPDPVFPKEIVLYRNYPNPFNPSTLIKYYLPVQGKIELKVYNVLGQEVRVLERGLNSAGEHKVIWDGKNDQGKAVSSGVYIYRLVFNNKVKTNKMLLIR